MTHQATPNERPTINDIFRTYGPAYLAKYQDRMSADQIKAVKAIMSCRTSQLGFVVYRCQHCGNIHQVPKSCGNRHCPTCQGSKAKAWLHEQLERTLPCAYFMITFTVPQEFRRFVRSHPRECYKALFKAAYGTLVQLAKGNKHVGSSKLGATGVLHTWGRDLSYHPHVHFLVPGGAISEDGNAWLSSRSDFFVPIYAASKIFRAKYRDLMERSGLLDKIPSSVWEKAWLVNSQAVGDGRGALRYLAPYVFRVAIGNRRIIRVTEGPDRKGIVTFSYKPSGTNRYKTMTVAAEEFLRRFLQHVLPSGFQKVRHFGFQHKRAKTNWEWLSMLVTVTLNMVYTLTVSMRPVQAKRSLICPDCGGELICLGVADGAAVPHSAFDSS